VHLFDWLYFILQSFRVLICVRVAGGELNGDFLFGLHASGRDHLAHVSDADALDYLVFLSEGVRHDCIKQLRFLTFKLIN